MKKIENVKELVEKIDATKKVNPKDLSSDQDLSIALMNLISIEEHLVFSGAKTGKTSFYDLIEGVREMRKTLMQKPARKCSTDAPRHSPRKASSRKLWTITSSLRKIRNRSTVQSQL